MNTMFSFEVPYKHTEDFKHLQDYTFLLPSDPPSRPKPPVILDNGFNEYGEPLSPEALAMKYLEPQAKVDFVIAPDHIDKNFEWHLTQAFELLACGIPLHAIMMVAQNPDWIPRYLDLGFSAIAVPYRRRLSGYKKWVFGTAKPFHYHFLGLAHPAELLYCQPDTIDTSMPIKLAMQGISLREWLRKGCPHLHTIDMPEYFEAELTPEQVALAEQNIKLLKRFVR
jgi:hypothetical protein